MVAQVNWFLLITITIIKASMASVLIMVMSQEEWLEEEHYGNANNSSYCENDLCKVL